MKYKKNILVNSIDQQNRLHKKHKINDPNTIIVEKSNTLKFIINFTTFLIRTLSLIILFILATIGLAAIIYPEPREALLNIIKNIIIQLNSMG